MKDIANIVSQVSASTLPARFHGSSSIPAFTTGPVGTAIIADRAETRQRNPKSSIQSSSTKPKAMASSLQKKERLWEYF
jgi:hypothetical protein